MNPDRAREIIWSLSSYFTIREPSLRFRRQGGGVYYRRNCSIVVGENETEDILLHEFAHHLNAEEGQEDYFRGTAPRRRSHGPEFWECLDRVIKFWLDDPKKYDWSTEYDSGRRFAEKKGYIPPRMKLDRRWHTLVLRTTRKLGKEAGHERIPDSNGAVWSNSLTETYYSLHSTPHDTYPLFFLRKVTTCWWADRCWYLTEDEAMTLMEELKSIGETVI